MTFLSKRPESYRPLLNRSLKLTAAVFSSIYLYTLFLSVIVFFPKLLASSNYVYTIFFISHPLIYNITLMALNLIAICLIMVMLWRVHCRIERLSLKKASVSIRKLFYVLIGGLIEACVLAAIMIAINGFFLLFKYFHLLFNTQFISLLFTTVVFAAELCLLIYVYILFYFLIPIIVIEGKNTIVAIEKSFSLAWNHPLKIFLFQATPWVFYTLFLIIVKYFLRIDLTVYVFDVAQRDYKLILLNILVFSCFLPWVIATIIVQLKDLELRKSLIKKNKK